LLSESKLDDDILSLDPANLAQLLPERVHEDRHTGGSAWFKQADAGRFSPAVAPPLSLQN